MPKPRRRPSHTLRRLCAHDVLERGELEERLPGLVSPFDARNVDCAAYRLSVGPEVYVSPAGGADDPNVRTKKQLAQRESVIVPPGQFGFLVTEEVVRVPVDAIAFISIRAKVKSRGLVNVSGFHADPGYEGRLVFAVFNAGPAPVHLARGDDCFLIWFADLDRASWHVKRGGGYDGIPSELINPIAGEVQSFAGLFKKIKDTEEALEKRLSAVERYNTAVLLIGGALLSVLVGIGLNKGAPFLATVNPPGVASPSNAGPAANGRAARGVQTP